MRIKKNKGWRNKMTKTMAQKLRSIIDNRLNKVGYKYILCYSKTDESCGVPIACNSKHIKFDDGGENYSFCQLSKRRMQWLALHTDLLFQLRNLPQILGHEDDCYSRLLNQRQSVDIVGPMPNCMKIRAIPRRK